MAALVMAAALVCDDAQIKGSETAVLPPTGLVVLTAIRFDLVGMALRRIITR